MYQSRYILPIIAIFVMCIIPLKSYGRDTFEVQAKVSAPGSNFQIHTKGIYPKGTGWVKGPWVSVADYFTLNHSKFKSLHIYIKRIELGGESQSVTPAEILTQRIKPFLKKTQSSSGGINYKPVFKVIYEKDAKVGKSKAKGFKAEYHYDNPEKTLMAVRYYIVSGGDHMNLITFTGQKNQFDAFKKRFDEFVGQLEFLH